MIVMNDMKKLAAINGPCLTIYQPLRDAFSQVTKADTRLTAAAQRADELLIEKGFDAEARARFLRPILKIARNTKWAGRTGSVVIFRAPGFTKASFWPDILDARVSLADDFFILPLLAGLTFKRTFWVLALSIKNIRLLHGTLAGLNEVELPSTLPRSLIDAEGFAPPDHDLAGQSSGGRSNGQTGSVHFGTSSLHDNQPAYLRDFFKMIDRGIHPKLVRSGEPLVLAAVPREIAIYRDVNTYTGLLPQAIHGSPDATTDHHLHQKALEVVAANQTPLNGRAHKQMENAADKGLLVTEAFAMREAARRGQVERLFVNIGRSADEEFVNTAALGTIRNSGEIVCGESPEGTTAAILRYRVAEPAFAAG
jgi:hypothetical protein